MKAKHIRLVLGITAVMLVTAGCKKSTEPNEPVSEPTQTVTVEPTKAPEKEKPSPTVKPVFNEEPEVFDESMALQIAKEMTQEMLDGKFERIAKAMPDETQATYTPEYLKSGYDTTVLPLGSFIGVQESKAQTVDGIIYVGSILEYENNGLLVTFGFNTEQRLTTFYLNYQTIEKEEETSDLYTEKDITVGSSQFPLNGILTMPANVKNPPIVVLVQGSGQNDMDETAGAVSNKPFEDIAKGLAEKGIASIRYNKRYYQYLDQMPETMTIYDEILDDVALAIDYAAGVDGIDSNKIYVAGHSLGGMLAPKIANDNPEVAGIIVLAGSARQLQDIIYDQNEEVLVQDDTLTEEERTQYLAMIKENIDAAKNVTADQLAEPMLGFTGYYWRALNEIDTKTIVTGLSIPMLFLQGSADFQVYPEKDFVLWKELLKGHDNASFIEYENLNHLFMPTTGARDVTDYNVKANVDDKVITDMAEWIKQK